ncbi:hypothetical protein JCM10207_000547 [Rhodosporidiobolus poonsookiae]
MCLATASLSYSLLVRSATLDFAAQAWPPLKRTLPFFHQTAFRLRTGFLHTSSPRREGHTPAVERVPVEIWEMIKHELIDLEAAAAEAKLVRRYTSCCCDECQFERAPLTTWEELVSYHAENDPPWLVEDMLDWTNNWWVDERLELCTELLSAFGLALAHTQPIRSPDSQFDLGESGTSITLSPRTPRGSTSSLNSGPHCGADSQPDGDSIFDLAFDLPTDADIRLMRFVKLFRLEVLRVELKQGSNGAATKELKAVKLSEIKPEWRLFSTCQM